MFRCIDSKKMGRSRLGWLDSHFHFSFAEYYNKDNIKFGVLRVVNDDIIQPGEGFALHPHRDMEIITYVIEGELTHKDSMGNERVLKRGEVQYMSAGTGVWHSEYNKGSEILRLLQIWILPDKKGYEPAYGDYRFGWEDRINKRLDMVTSSGNAQSGAPVKIHADINMYSIFIEAGGEHLVDTAEERQSYMILVEGNAEAGGYKLQTRDALEIIGQAAAVKALDYAHILVIEMREEK